MFKKSDFKRPNIALEGGSEKNNGVRGSVSMKCPSCKKTFFRSELPKTLWCCPICGAALRMSARERISMIADEGSFSEADEHLSPRDLIGFPGYPEKLERARRESGESESVVTGVCIVGGCKCALFVMEGGFMMGSMGTVTGEKLTRLFERALSERLPVLGFTVSGGARMQEGILSLMQMAKVSGAVRAHSDAGLLYTAVLTDPTTGGVTASFAMEADIILAEPGALIGFAGQRVIEQTTHQKLPAGFQRAEMLLEKGFLDGIAPRSAQKELISRILSLHEGRAQ